MKCTCLPREIQHLPPQDEQHLVWYSSVPLILKNHAYLSQSSYPQQVFQTLQRSQTWVCKGCNEASRAASVCCNFSPEHTYITLDFRCETRLHLSSKGSQWTGQRTVEVVLPVLIFSSSPWRRSISASKCQPHRTDRWSQTYSPIQICPWHQKIFI